MGNDRLGVARDEKEDDLRWGKAEAIVDKRGALSAEAAMVRTVERVDVQMRDDGK